ncbi:MAG: TonB-dependent receptor [Elusimicrobia bacterium]|nr:TonB-dependent receptor [Elusimicrobiota bacterium]
MGRASILCGALMAALFSSPALAGDDAFEFFREEAKVYTASRRAEPAAQAPVAVEVITADEIRAYGYTEIWDALRYRAGMDVVDGRSVDGNRALVSARGFTREFVTDMQVLVDGRSVYSPFIGGVYWESLPVQIQDIERIEIVRGPNAALYGSNAGLGVVNIITKAPGRAAAASVFARAGSMGDRAAATSAEAGGSRGGLRLSHEVRNLDGRPNASGTGEADDFLQSNKLNLRGEWRPTDAVKLEALGGGVWMNAGIPASGRDPRARHAQDFEMFRLTRSFDAGGAIEATLSRFDGAIDLDPLFLGDVDIRQYQYDAEALHRFSWLDGEAKTTWGMSARFSGVQSDQAFAGDPRQRNRLVRAFAHQSARVAEPLTLVAGVSLEHSDTGGTEPAWQAAALYEPVESQVFRLSFSRAPTIPTLFGARGDYRLAAGQRFVGNPALDPQELMSWEAGWSGRLLDGALKTGAALYYMRVEDRTFYSVSRVDPGPVSVITTDNRNEAIARGAEVSLEHAFGPGRTAFVNYTYERITDWKAVDALGNNPSHDTPVHKANLGGRAALGRGFAAAAVVGYKDAYSISSASRGLTARVPRSLRLDARVAWTPRPDWEVFLAGQDLLQPYRIEYADGTASPRRFEGGVTKRFGL